MSAPTAVQTQGTTPPAGALADPNLIYLRDTEELWTRCRAASGSATSLAYSNGATLIFDVPSVVGGYAEGFFVQIVGNAQYTPNGVGPTQALNPADFFALFNNLLVIYNGTLINVRPVIYKYLDRIKGYEHFRIDSSGPGFSDNFVQSKIRNTPLNLAPGANAFVFSFYVPLRLHADDAAGMVPIGSEAGTRLQMQLTCAPSNVGPDPILATWNTNGTVVVTGNVTVDTKYRDGSTVWGQDKLALNLNGTPVIQQLTEQQLNPLTQGTTVLRALSKLLIHHTILAFVVDGNQSNVYSAWSNYNMIGLAKDASGTNFFWQYGLGANNIPFDAFLRNQRKVYGQDVEDEGLCVLINGGALGVQDPDNYRGVRNLNMMPGHWTSVQHAYNLQTVNSGNGFTPRVEVYTILSNPAGFANLQD